MTSSDSSLTPSNSSSISSNSSLTLSNGSSTLSNSSLTSSIPSCNFLPSSIQNLIQFIDDAQYHSDLLPLFCKLPIDQTKKMMIGSIQTMRGTVINPLSLYKLSMSIQSINNILCDDIIQYILTFCSVSSRKHICKKWDHLVHLNIKKIQRIAMENSSIYGEIITGAIGIIIPQTSYIWGPQSKLSSFINTHTYGPFKTIEKAWKWWDVQYIQAVKESSNPVQTIPSMASNILNTSIITTSINNDIEPPVPEFSTFLLGNGLHNEEYCSDYDTGNPFHLRPGRIIGLGDRTIIYDSALDYPSICGILIEYGQDICFENIIFDATVKCYDKYCRNGYFQIESGASVVFKNCIFSWRCGPMPIISKTTVNAPSSLYNKLDAMIKIIGCIFENDDAKYINLNNIHGHINFINRDQKSNVEIYHSEYCRYPVFIYADS